MTAAAGTGGTPAGVIDRARLGDLIEVLRARGHRVVGPTVREGVLVHGEITSDTDLPVGWTDDQAPGSYRLRRADSPAVFDAGVGPHSAKQHFFPPRSTLVEEDASTGSWAFRPATRDEPPPALIGVRACDVAAIAIQDRVLRDGAYPDATYSARREGAFIVAVNCGRAGGTCFCVSMDCGPRATSGFDLALTELLDPPGHRFLVEVGSDRGATVLEAIPHRAATAADHGAADAAVARAAGQMGRTLDTRGLRELLQDNWEHPRWDEVAARCLSCGNCTMVCPTCFCATVEEVPALDGGVATRERHWDSCFSKAHSYLHGGRVRVGTRARYRQWMTHKLSTWIDQFGTSGCVGCGRCVSWCPVGIDITEEAAAIRASSSPQEARP